MMGIMGVSMRILGIGSALVLSVCMHSAWALDCSSYTGTRVDTTKDVVALVNKGTAAVHGHNVRGLFSLSSSKLTYLRRSVTDAGTPEGRAGNIRLALRPRDMDAELRVRIGNQMFTEFAENGLFDGLDTANAISIPREVCEGVDRCEDALPPSEGVPFMMKNLLQCNQNGKAIYMFSDGIFVTDMQLNGGKVPLGGALFFAKGNKGYYLAGLIAQH